jgi:peptidoglycan/LPS O-acetylase OafA/YrhL
MTLAVVGIACSVTADVWQPKWLIDLCALQTSWLFPGQFPGMQQKAFGAVLLLTGIIDLQVCRDLLSKPWLVACSRLSFPLYLVHWPIMCGLAAAAFVQLLPYMGVGAAQFCALGLGIAASMAASVVFAMVDRHAVRLSWRLRRRAADPAATAHRARVAHASTMEAAG